MVFVRKQCFFDVFDEINSIFRSFLEEKSDFSQKNQRKRNFPREKSDSWTDNRCLWDPYGIPRRPKKYHKLQKQRVYSKKERLGIQKSLFFRTKSFFLGLWYLYGTEWRFTNAFYVTLAFFLKFCKKIANAFFFRRWPSTIRYHKGGAHRKSLFFAKLLHKIALFCKTSLLR